MGPSRLAPPLVGVLLLTALASAQVPPPLPGPPGYRLVDSSDSLNETEEFSTTPLDRERVTGRRIISLYEPLPLLKKRPINILRHYVAQAEARGGVRLFGFADETGGQVSAYVPGTRPLWVTVRPSEEGGGLEVIFVEEAEPRARRLPVPAERIAGRWAADQPELGLYPASAREAFRTLFTQVAAHLRSAAALSPPMGATYIVSTSAGESMPDSGLPPFDVRLIARPHHQACATCAVHVGDGLRLIEVSVNQLEKAAPSSPLKGPGDTDWFEWHLDKQISPTVARSADGRLLLTLPGRPSPWVAVTREAYLTAQIAALDDAARPPDLKKAMAEQEEAIRAIEKVDPAAARAARQAMKEAMASMADVKGGLAPERDRLEQELKGLSPADRGQPAVLPNGAALVARNPAYAQVHLPATAVQLVVVRYSDPPDYFFKGLTDRLAAIEWAWLVDGAGTRR